MAFWKRLGKNKTVPANDDLRKTNHKLHNNNDSVNGSSVSLSISTSSSGDLGESMFNSLQQSPVQETKSSDSKPKSLLDITSSEFGDLSGLSVSETVRTWSRRSRLSKNLAEVLSDLTALSFFQQFLESRQAGSYLTLLNDIKHYNLLAASLNSSVSNCSSPTANGDGLQEARWSPGRNTTDIPRSALYLLNSASSSSGFSDDSNSLDSPRHRANARPAETETMWHSLLSERRRIVQKYFDPDSSEYVPDLVGLLRDPETMDATADSSSLLDVFHDVQIGLRNLLEEEYFSEYLHSEYHYRYQLELITGGKLLITDILHNDSSLFYFMEYMDQEGKRHWLEFWLAADNYRSQWNACNAPSDALIIYNKYFSLQATQPLGLADSIRSSIEENICMTNTGPGPDCFECAIHVLLCAMDKRYLKPFLSSPVFCQYVNDVISALKNASSALSRSKRSGSDSTINSEVSGVSSSAISVVTASSQAGASSSHGALANNTENSMIRLGNSISNESLQIDIRQLNDPDSLWHRRKTTLSLGRLTPLGRFRTEVEPLPERKSGSKLSKAVRKFVFVEEDEEKEEAAWQVAEMIIRDVTAITLLNGSAMNDDYESAVPSSVSAASI